MNNYLKEQNIILELCKICENNKGLLENELTEELDYPYILGHLMYNRIAPMAYVKLQEYDLLKGLNREFVNSLKSSYTASKLITDGFKTFLSSLSYIFEKENKPFALLKGSYLCNLYPKGTRTSNDVDILINKEDVSHFVEVIKLYGYNHGFIRGGEFVPASRKEIIESRINNGETVPLIKESGIGTIKYFEIDLNYSLDYKAKQDNNLVNELLKNRQELIETYHEKLPTLNHCDFLIYLCMHLFKEATVYDWVKRERDLSLYKFVDIYLFLKKFVTSDFAVELRKTIIEYGFEKECYYAFSNTCHLFNITDEHILKMIEEIQPVDLSYMKQIIYPSKKKTYQYDIDFKEWCFLNNRKDYLNEIGAQT